MKVFAKLDCSFDINVSFFKLSLRGELGPDK